MKKPPQAQTLAPSKMNSQYMKPQSDSDALPGVQQQAPHLKSRQQKFESHQNVNKTEPKLQTAQTMVLSKRHNTKSTKRGNLVEPHENIEEIRSTRRNQHPRNTSTASLPKPDNQRLSQTQSVKNLNQQMQGVREILNSEMTSNQCTDDQQMERNGSTGLLKKPVKVKVRCNFQFNLPRDQSQPTIGQLQAPVQALQEFFPSLPSLFQSTTPAKKMTAVRSGLPVYKKAQNLPEARVSGSMGQTTNEYATDDVHDVNATQIHPVQSTEQQPASLVVEPTQQYYQTEPDHSIQIEYSKIDPNLQIAQSPIAPNITDVGQSPAAASRPGNSSEIKMIQSPDGHESHASLHEAPQSHSQLYDAAQHQQNPVFMPAKSGQMTMFDHPPQSQYGTGQETPLTQNEFSKVQDQLMAMNNYLNHTNLITRIQQQPQSATPAILTITQEGAFDQNQAETLQHQIQQQLGNVQVESISEIRQTSEKACSPIPRSPRKSPKRQPNHKPKQNQASEAPKQEISKIPSYQPKYTHDQQCMTSFRRTDTQNRGNSPIQTQTTNNRGSSPIQKHSINDRGCSPIQSELKNDRASSPVQEPPKQIHDRGSSPIQLSSREIIQSKQDEKQHQEEPSLKELREQECQTLTEAAEEQPEPSKPVLVSQSTQSSVQFQDQSTHTPQPQLIDQNVETVKQQANEPAKQIDNSDQKTEPTILHKISSQQDSNQVHCEDVRLRSSIESINKPQKQKSIGKREFREDFINMQLPSSEYNSVGASAHTRITGSDNGGKKKQSTLVATSVMKGGCNSSKEESKEKVASFPLPKSSNAKATLQRVIKVQSVASLLSKQIYDSPQQFDQFSQQEVSKQEVQPEEEEVRPVEDEIQGGVTEEPAFRENTPELLAEVEVENQAEPEQTVQPEDLSLAQISNREVASPHQSEIALNESQKQIHFPQPIDFQQKLPSPQPIDSQRDIHLPELNKTQMLLDSNRHSQHKLIDSQRQSFSKPIDSQRNWPVQTKPIDSQRQIVQTRPSFEIPDDSRKPFDCLEQHQLLDAEIRTPSIHDQTATTNLGMVSQNLQIGDAKYVDRSYASVHQMLPSSSRRQRRLNCQIENLNFQEIEIFGKSPAEIVKPDVEPTNVEQEDQLKDKLPCVVQNLELQIQVLPIEKSASLRLQERQHKMIRTGTIDLGGQVEITPDKPLDVGSHIERVEQEESYQEVVVENDLPEPTGDIIATESVAAGSQVKTPPIQQSQAGSPHNNSHHKYGFPDAIESLDVRDVDASGGEYIDHAMTPIKNAKEEETKEDDGSPNQILFAEESVHVVESERAELAKPSNPQFTMTLSNIPAPNTYATQVELIKQASTEEQQQIIERMMDIQNDSKLHVSACMSERFPPPPEKMSIVKDVELDDQILMNVQEHYDSAEETDETPMCIKLQRKLAAKAVQQPESDEEPKQQPLGILALQKMRVIDRKDRKVKFRTLINAMHRPKKKEKIENSVILSQTVVPNNVRKVRPMCSAASLSEYRSMGAASNGIE